MGNCFEYSVSIIKEIENSDGLTNDEIKIIYHCTFKDKNTTNITLILKNTKNIKIAK
jgi:hypothetical protein